MSSSTSHFTHFPAIILKKPKKTSQPFHGVINNVQNSSLLLVRNKSWSTDSWSKFRWRGTINQDNFWYRRCRSQNKVSLIIIWLTVPRRLMDGVIHPSIVRAGLFQTDLAVYKTGGLSPLCLLFKISVQERKYLLFCVC